MSVLIPTLSIVFPAIDPVLVQVGPIAIRWYALSYVAGIMIGWWLLARLDNKKPKVFNQKAYDDFVIWAILGILIGGRIGYVLFYNAPYYLENPGEIIKVWKGGMAFHGGLIGAIVSMYLMSRVHKLNFLKVMDLLAVITPIGLFFGRIANFINAELYGRITDVSWGVIFPGDPFARHPSQLYEAVMEGALLFAIMLFLINKTDLRKKPGALSGCFLVGYWASRSIAELFREPDVQIGFLMGGITMGQILSLPMLIGGIYLIMRKHKKNAA